MTCLLRFYPKIKGIKDAHPYPGTAMEQAQLPKKNSVIARTVRNVFVSH